jgi:hypothetical protein
VLFDHLLDARAFAACGSNDVRSGRLQCQTPKSKKWLAISAHDHKSFHSAPLPGPFPSSVASSAPDAGRAMSLSFRHAFAGNGTRKGQVKAPTTMARVTKQRTRSRQNSSGYFGDRFGLLLDRRSPDRRSSFERRSPINRRSSSDRVSTPLRRSTFDRRSSLDRLSSLVIGASPFVTQNGNGC